MKKLHFLFEKAKKSNFYKWLLNRVLWKVVPFNNSHKLRIVKVADDEIKIEAPYIKNNKNHLNGLHACVLATLCEYTIGLNLMLHIDPKKYRLIMKSIKMEYHFQAKGSVIAKWGINMQEIDEMLNQLDTEGLLLKTFIIQLNDLENNHICTGNVEWQIKEWKQVKTTL
ncbi:MAG TPA: DUF4442 domain-containing protein [Edaphocola sp.]|nr:DUF4442 domain-containing protein [Edaphocola sp.]